MTQWGWEDWGELPPCPQSRDTTLRRLSPKLIKFPHFWHQVVCDADFHSWRKKKRTLLNVLFIWLCKLQQLILFAVTVWNRKGRKGPRLWNMGTRSSPLNLTRCWVTQKRISNSFVTAVFYSPVTIRPISLTLSTIFCSPRSGASQCINGMRHAKGNIFFIAVYTYTASYRISR